MEVKGLLVTAFETIFVLKNKDNKESPDNMIGSDVLSPNPR